VEMNDLVLSDAHGEKDRALHMTDAMHRERASTVRRVGRLWRFQPLRLE
jgi:predicted phosphodiesterase